MQNERQLQERADAAAGAYGRGLRLVQTGEISPHECGVLKRRDKKAQEDLRAFRYRQLAGAA